jgi:hypothetical protein
MRMIVVSVPLAAPGVAHRTPVAIIAGSRGRTVG